MERLHLKKTTNKFVHGLTVSLNDRLCFILRGR